VEDIKGLHATYVFHPFSLNLPLYLRIFNHSDSENWFPPSQLLPKYFVTIILRLNNPILTNKLLHTRNKKRNNVPPPPLPHQQEEEIGSCKGCLWDCACITTCCGWICESAFWTGTAWDGAAKADGGIFGMSIEVRRGMIFVSVIVLMVIAQSINGLCLMCAIGD
jgi:hypothetical protein